MIILRKVDPERIGIAGESGGGYICAGAMVYIATVVVVIIIIIVVIIIIIIITIITIVVTRWSSTLREG